MLVHERRRGQHIGAKSEHIDVPGEHDGASREVIGASGLLYGASEGLDTFAREDRGASTAPIGFSGAPNVKSGLLIWIGQSRH